MVNSSVNQERRRDLTKIPPKIYIFDLDGVIYRGSEPLPHASDVVSELRNRGRAVYFLTNNSTRSRNDYASKLSGMGIHTKPSDVMTSAYATALFLKHKNVNGVSAYVVGEDGLRKELRDAGIKILGSDASSVDYVVAGLDRSFDYDKLAAAQRLIIGGAVFVATNRDPTFPIENGAVLPGGGSIVSAIETASGTTPIVIGKPETYCVQMILESAGCSADEAVMVGDRLDTDIMMGNRVGMKTAFVLTGVCDRDDIPNAPSDMHPNIVISDLIELLDEGWASN